MKGGEVPEPINFTWVNILTSVRTEQRTLLPQYKNESVNKQYKEAIAVYFEKYTKHKNTRYRNNSQYFHVKPGGLYSNHSGIKWSTAAAKFSPQEGHVIRKDRPRAAFLYICLETCGGGGG